MLTRNMLADGYHLHEPATRSAIDRCEQEAGYGFPEDYVALLLISDGLRTDGNLSLLDVESIGERNRDYEVQDYLPGFVMIGDDSGGNALLMKTGDAAVYEVGMGVMDEATMVKSAATIEELLIGHKGKTLSER
ncbi:SMI1/KNR4 family protein [Paracoccus kondratievae]|uniref:SMI1/KNR4 family protein n=1 Tax=Paracoccus kondratievae TaxID=135740 RepID=UPI0022F25470|nr:SMI1/KNR4 family protein [Paracoccus kondratievae]